MPALAHIGVGFVAKRIAPKIQVGYLILAAEFIEILYMVFWALGIEHPLTDSRDSFSPYSHSLVMGFVWTGLVMLMMLIFTKNKRLILIIGMLVLSHTILDFIASPKTAFYPTDEGMPLFLDTSVTTGLGLWRYKIVGLIGEYGTLLAGIVVYIFTKRKLKKEKKQAAYISE